MHTHMRVHCGVKGLAQARVLLQRGVLGNELLLEGAQALIAARRRGSLCLRHICIKLVHQLCCIREVYLPLSITSNKNISILHACAHLGLFKLKYCYAI